MSRGRWWVLGLASFAAAVLAPWIGFTVVFGALSLGCLRAAAR